ncbi:MAG: class I SAM-dependent methyltransferase [Cytophagales bacterium]|nr:class I SAM-dependent methyltransferase [Cytophagales bacterium]
MTEVSEFYDDYSNFQHSRGINHRHLSIQRWLEFFGLKGSDQVLEIGCGIGTQTELVLRYLTTGSITGIDISEKSIELAKQRLAKYNNQELIAGDVVQLDIQKKYDIILMPDVLEHIPIEQHARLFSKLELLLKQDGLLIIHIPDPDSLKWIRKNQPETLQIIDQPIELGELLGNLKHTSFKIEYLHSYSIYSTDPDYQLIVMRKNISERSYKNRQAFLDDSFSRKAKRKLSYYLRGLK